MTVSTAANETIEASLPATAGPKWFQLYLHDDRGPSRELLQRAKSAGYSAVVFTIDAFAPGSPDETLRLGFSFPADLPLVNRKTALFKKSLSLRSHHRSCARRLTTRPHYWRLPGAKPFPSASTRRRHRICRDFCIVGTRIVWAASGRCAAIKAYLQLIFVTVSRLLGQEKNHPVSRKRDAEAVIRFRELVEQHYRSHLPLDLRTTVGRHDRTAQRCVPVPQREVVADADQRSDPD